MERRLDAPAAYQSDENVDSTGCQATKSVKLLKAQYSSLVRIYQHFQQNV